MAAPVVGNQDFRGYLNYLARSGDNAAYQALQFAGNDGKIDPRAQGTYGGGAQALAQYTQDAFKKYNTINAGGGLPNGNKNGATVTTGATGAGANPAQYDQAISDTQKQLNRLGAQQQSGYGAIDSSFQNALHQLLLSKNQGQASYDTAKHQSALDYVGAKNTIGSQAGGSLRGLLRLLGSRGAGGGSTYNIAAPEAIGRAATGQRQDVANTFGQNNQALDTNWNTFLTDYTNQVSSAGNQRKTARQGLDQSIAGNRASLLQSLASLNAQKNIAQGGTGVAQAQPYLNQANSILDHLASYQTPEINYKTSAYTAPDISKYTVNPNAAPTNQGQSPTNDYFSPSLFALLGKRQQAFA